MNTDVQLRQCVHYEST